MTRGARRVARATGEAAAARPAPQGGDEVPAPSPRIAAGVTSGRRALRLLARARDLAHVEYGVVDAAVSLAQLHRRRLLPRSLAAHVHGGDTVNVCSQGTGKQATAVQM